MTSVDTITLEVPDPGAARHFYATAFGLDTQLHLRASEQPTSGFRGFTLALTVTQPTTGAVPAPCSGQGCRCLPGWR